jgi:hypothetical protein
MILTPKRMRQKRNEMVRCSLGKIPLQADYLAMSELRTVRGGKQQVVRNTVWSMSEYP